MHLPFSILALTPTLVYSEPLLATTALVPGPPSTTTSSSLSSNGVSKSDRQKALQIAGKALTNSSNLPDPLTVDTIAIIVLDSMLDKIAMTASSMPKHGKELARLYGDLKPLANCEVMNRQNKNKITEICAGPKSSLSKTLQEIPEICADLYLIGTIPLDLIGAVFVTILDLLAGVGDFLGLGNLGSAILAILEEVFLIIEEILGVVLEAPGQLCELLLGSGDSEG